MMLIPINLGIVESLVALHKTDDIQYAQTLLDELKDTLFQKDELLQYYDLQSKICQL